MVRHRVYSFQVVIEDLSIGLIITVREAIVQKVSGWVGGMVEPLDRLPEWFWVGMEVGFVLTADSSHPVLMEGLHCVTAYFNLWMRLENTSCR